MKTHKRLISLLLLILMVFQISPLVYAADKAPAVNYVDSKEKSTFANGKGGVFVIRHQGWRI